MITKGSWNEQYVALLHVIVVVSSGSWTYGKRASDVSLPTSRCVFVYVCASETALASELFVTLLLILYIGFWGDSLKLL